MTGKIFFLGFYITTRWYNITKIKWEITFLKYIVLILASCHGCFNVEPKTNKKNHVVH